MPRKKKNLDNFIIKGDVGNDRLRKIMIMTLI